MLGFAGSGIVKSLKVFQVICHNCYRSFENAENIFRERKKQLARGRALAQEKYDLKRTKENTAQTKCCRNLSWLRRISREKWTSTGT